MPIRSSVDADGVIHGIPDPRRKTSKAAGD